MPVKYALLIFLLALMIVALLSVTMTVSVLLMKCVVVMAVVNRA